MGQATAAYTPGSFLTPLPVARSAPTLALTEPRGLGFLVCKMRGRGQARDFVVRMLETAKKEKNRAERGAVCARRTCRSSPLTWRSYQKSSKTALRSSFRQDFFFFLYLLQKAGLSHLGLCIPVLLSPFFFFPLCAFPFIDSFSAFFKTENRHFLFRSYKAQCRKARHLVSRCKRQGGININAHIRTMSLSSVFESLNQERLWSVTSPRPPLRHAERLTGGSVRS